jgi:hypothetical protein
MANRRFEQFQLSLEKKVVTLWSNISVGAAGAPTAPVAKNKGIKSIVRNSAGNYTINLQDSYQYLMFMDSCIVLGAGGPSAGTNVQIVVRADNSASLAAPAVQVEVLNAAGTAVDLASGSSLLIMLELKNSTV